MGKTPPLKLREVVYTLSANETNVMAGLWKDLPAKIHRKISEVSGVPIFKRGLLCSVMVL